MKKACGYNAWTEIPVFKSSKDRPLPKIPEKKFAEGKSCNNCVHRDRCLYDHNPGKNYICWKRDPRVR